jgi:DNA-binding NarL/FixJ family response regulator
MATIRLLIVDDHAVVRLGLQTLLADEADLEVVAEAGSAEDAMLQLEQKKPDIAVVDIQLPGRSGIEICREIRKRFPETRVVILTSHAGEAFVEQAMRAGASGYVLKQVGNEELIRAIRAAYRGEVALDSQTSSKVVSRYLDLEKKADQSAFRELSHREKEVLFLVAEGESNREIGEKLNLTEITVRNYVSNILSKLQLRNRIELAKYAFENHLKDYME